MTADGLRTRSHRGGCRAAGPCRRLKRSGKQSPASRGWLSTSITRKSDIRYIVTAFAFLIAGGVEALVFRLQLAGRTFIC